MTDNDLNRLIAEIGNSDPYRAADYCNDPAAWGALFVWLAEHDDGRDLRIGYHQKWYAANVKGQVRSDAIPGRALVLATLAAYGVEVE